MQGALADLLKVPVAALSREYRAGELDLRVELPFVLRLDGAGFSRALAGFEAPRDERVHRALVAAATQIVERMSASGAYVCSDEVNVLFLGPAKPYGGRLQKLVSVSASAVSSRVSLELGRQLLFDSRVVPLSGVEAAKRYVLFRARVALNNYVGCLARLSGLKYARPPSLEKQMLDLAERGVDVVSRPAWALLGSSVYWSWSGARRRTSVSNGFEELVRSLEMYRGPEAP